MKFQDSAKIRQSESAFHILNQHKFHMVRAPSPEHSLLTAGYKTRDERAENAQHETYRHDGNILCHSGDFQIRLV